MLPLKINVQQYGQLEDACANIRSALKRGLVELTAAPCKNDGHFVIAASGCSLPTMVEEIRAEVSLGRPICAINGAYDFLVENDIIPDLFVTCDPRPMPQNMRNPQPETIFMPASRANPGLFDTLEKFNVLLWHSYNMNDEQKELTGKFCVGGGSTSGLRAMNIGYVMGFRRFILYGFDSCLAADKDTKRFTGEGVGKVGKVIDVIVGGRRFFANGAMAQQAHEFQELYGSLTDATVEAKGDGLIAAIIAERKKRGLRT